MKNPTVRNQGEGDKEAARRYNKAASENAEENLDIDASPDSREEDAELKGAEEKGRSRRRE
jgi:hypothetical protein